VTVAGTAEATTNRFGHSLAPLMARAWTQRDGAGSLHEPGYSPARPSQPFLVEIDEDPLLEACRAAIEETETATPGCDLELARILADARENARLEARRKKTEAEETSKTRDRQAFVAPIQPEDMKDFNFRPEQPPMAYFRDRKISRTRVPGRGRDIEKGKVFDSFGFLASRDNDPEAEPVPIGQKAAKRGLVAWTVVYPSPVAMRAGPKAAARLVGQLDPGDVIFSAPKDRSGDWVRVAEVQGQQTPDEAWVLTDGSDFGMGHLLRRI